MKPQSVLAITATAGRQVVNDICRTLEIDNACSSESGSGVWTMKSDRDNINVETFITSSQEMRLSMVSTSSIDIIEHDSQSSN